MKTILAISSLVATLLMAVVPAAAHGYVSQPPSRQARCRDQHVPDCGPVAYEPQSVEAGKGSFLCNGNGARFPELNKDSLWVEFYAKIHPSADDHHTFTWTLTAPHRTTTWEYFVLHGEEHKLLTSFDDGGQIPQPTVIHSVPLTGLRGRQKLLARWNIADTPAAFYSCIDLDITPPSTAVPAVAAATQLPIAEALAGPVLDFTRTNASSSASAGPSVGVPPQNVFAMYGSSA